MLKSFVEEVRVFVVIGFIVMEIFQDFLLNRIWSLKRCHRMAAAERVVVGLLLLLLLLLEGCLSVRHG